MSKINISRNVFLEREELTNMLSFFATAPLMKAVLQASYSFGMITNDPSKISPNTVNKPTNEDNLVDPFKVETGTNSGTIKILPGMALTSQGEFIDIGVEDNIAVPNDSNFYWVKIGYQTRNYEKGYVSVNSQGVVSGSVNFSGKVRGQSSSTPVSIRFEKQDGSVPINNGVYQIVNVIDNQNLLLTSASTFVAESNLRVIVLGTLPLGGVLTSEQRNGLYTYDDYVISLVPEVSVSTPPEKEADEYYIARVQNSGGTVSVSNEVKSEYWSLGNIFMSTPKS
jgi:hypothetical protein|nr:MAG TPA: hypothetical protein [Caudoviricetes sp.]